VKQKDRETVEASSETQLAVSLGILYRLQLDSSKERHSVHSTAEYLELEMARKTGCHWVELSDSFHMFLGKQRELGNAQQEKDVIITHTYLFRAGLE
jgi:hypothetical protein